VVYSARATGVEHGLGARTSLETCSPCSEGIKEYELTKKCLNPAPRHQHGYPNGYLFGYLHGYDGIKDFF
jgi:hypothetical protein